ncbi:MAG TPA: HEAT repeat domain-containing protein, partial [Blastocatellia bacterium]|nr:HEAT repeat domain-containing protein [Blastocatellia bacterium]
LSAAERRPWILPKLYDFLPKNTDTHDRLYKALTKDPKEFDDIEDNNWRSSLYRWLQFNTRYLRDELIEAVRTGDNNEYDKLGQIAALAKLNWPTAKPILEKIVAEGRSLSYPTALSWLYECVMKGPDASQAEAYREILKRLAVEDGLSPVSRLTVMKSLLREEWVGQEEWYVSLFSGPKILGFDESAGRPRGGVLIEEMNRALRRSPSRRKASDLKLSTFMIPRSDMVYLSTALNLNPGRWIPVITGLTDHKDPAVRDAAVSALMGFLLIGFSNDVENTKKASESAARALLPWLTNPNWVSVPCRTNYLFRLADIDMPESIPGLLWVVDNDENAYAREVAVDALTRYCDPRARPVLKQVLSGESDEVVRDQMALSLARCGGFLDEEMAAAVEAYADVAATVESRRTIKAISSGESEKPIPLNVMIGQALFESDMSWASEGFAAILFERLKELRPGAAKLILDKIRALPLNVARVKLIERISDGSANLDDLKLALQDRGALVEDLRIELSDLVKRGGYAGGIAAIMMEDRDIQIGILKGKDVKAQIALLAGARYLIEMLPTELLRGLIASPEKTLAQAVENYLEVEGGAARGLTLARRPNESKILGDISCLADYKNELGDLKAWEEKLRGELLAPGGVEEVYALAPAVPSERLKGMVIRVRHGKAEVSVYDVEGSRKTRRLDEGEFRELKDFTSLPEVEDLGPESWRINKPIIPYEYLCLTKEGGRRVILTGYRSAPTSPSLHEKLADLFYRIGESGEYKTR